MSDRNIVFPLEDIFGDRFGRYSKYIIQDRALPDVRDGLKPVQRRILYAMHVEGNTYNKPTRKSAKTVGVVIGNYHPHGDTSVYDAMVRMSQWWKQNEPLIDMQGNNGSIDNDPAAAMRYTEARLSNISSQLLRDIEKDTVSMAYTFDDTSLEPTVLPCRFPNLLVNGSKGIAAGYATEIPPHNLGEVIDATIYRIKNKNCTTEELMEYIKGPDFPTGGIVQGKEGILEAFKTGRGKCVIKSKTEIVESKSGKQIIITEIPFEVVKSDLVRSIDQLAFDKKVDGIVEVRDESDKEVGIRIAIDLKKDVDANIILNFLMKQTSLQINYNYNVIAISNKRPMLMGLTQILDAYINHQVDVDTRRTVFELNKAKARLHIIEGLIIAINNLDEVISLIRASKDKAECKTKLQDRFKLSEKQSEAVVTMQLYRLSSTDITMLKNERSELEELCIELNSLLEDDKKMKKLIISELTDVKKMYAQDRKSVIQDQVDDLVIDKMAMVSKEEVMISVSRKGYCKRSSMKSYSASEGAFPSTKENDILVAVTQANTVDTLLLFTNKGNYLYIPVFELAEGKWKDEGVHINNVVTLTSEEYIINALLVKDFKKDINIVMVSKNGIIKKSSLEEFKVQRYTKPVKCMSLKSDDCMVGANYSNGDSEVVVISETGNVLRYHESGVPLSGLKSSGVKAVSDVGKTGLIVGFVVLTDETAKLTYLVTDKGGHKVINPRNVNLTLRTNKATSVYKCFKSDPHKTVGFGMVDESKKAYALTNKNEVIEVDVSERGQPFDKNMRAELDLKEKELVVVTSTLSVSCIDKDTPTFHVEEEHFTLEKKEEKNEEVKEEGYEKVSILDLLGEDF